MIAYFKDQLQILSESFETLEQNDFDILSHRCSLALCAGGKIIASGLGKNVPICEKFVGTMNSLGLDARFLHTNTAIHGDLGMVNPHDLVLLLSKSGNTVESILLANHLIQRGCETWLLSFSKNSKLSSILKNSIIMDLKNEGDLWDIVPNNSTTIYLILLQGLALHIAADAGIQLHDFKMNHPGGGIGEKLRDVE
jgi:arabinose-5-phosphate isomerase